MEQVDHKALLAELQQHVDADLLVKGRYWEDGKGCAVGCTLHSYAKIIGKRSLPWDDHSIYDDIFGLGGQMLGQLEDKIFEGMTNGDAQAWPVRFTSSALAAIERGSTLERVGWQFLHWLLTNHAVNPGIDHSLVSDAVKQCADIIFSLTKGERIDASAAWSAARSAESAASAAWSAASAASAESAASAAYKHMSDKLVELMDAA